MKLLLYHIIILLHDTLKTQKMPENKGIIILFFQNDFRLNKIKQDVKTVIESLCVNKVWQRYFPTSNVPTEHTMLLRR